MLSSILPPMKVWFVYLLFRWQIKLNLIIYKPKFPEISYYIFMKIIEFEKNICYNFCNWFYIKILQIFKKVYKF